HNCEQLVWARAAEVTGDNNLLGYVRPPGQLEKTACACGGWEASYFPFGTRRERVLSLENPFAVTGRLHYHTCLSCSRHDEYFPIDDWSATTELKWSGCSCDNGYRENAVCWWTSRFVVCYLPGELRPQEVAGLCTIL